MKKIFVATVAVALGLCASASELWWTVSDSSGYTWDTASLCALKLSDNDGRLQNFGGESIAANIAAADLAEGGFEMTSLDGYESGYSFYVELYNSDTLVARSYVSMGNADAFLNQGSVTKEQLAQNVFDGSTFNPTATPYSFNQFTDQQVVPEPTSGLLVMLGMMMLGLKRKRV